jgi:hypothetical protein
MALSISLGSPRSLDIKRKKVLGHRCIRSYGGLGEAGEHGLYSSACLLGMLGM